VKINFGVDAGFGAHQIDHFSVLLGHVLLDLGQFCIVYDPEKKEKIKIIVSGQGLSFEAISFETKSKMG
jgi:hypothetical protein